MINQNSSAPAFGILAPKLSNKFVVLFSAAFNPTEDISAEQATMHLKTLTAQTIRVKIPNQIFDNTRPINSLQLDNEAFYPFQIDGPVVFTFEDDIANRLQEAIEFISRSDVTKFTATVSKLDGDEGVLEAFYFGSCKIKSISHSVLDYSGSDKTKYGSFRGSVSDKNVEPQFSTYQISGSFNSHGSETVQKELTLLPIYTQRAIFKGENAPKISDIQGIQS